MADCFGGHDFIFLRQEERKEGFDRDPLFITEDVFFCRACLKYERSIVKKEKNDRLTFGRVRVS